LIFISSLPLITTQHYSQNYLSISLSISQSTSELSSFLYKTHKNNGISDIISAHPMQSTLISQPCMYACTLLAKTTDLQNSPPVHHKPGPNAICLFDMKYLTKHPSTMHKMQPPHLLRPEGNNRPCPVVMCQVTHHLLIHEALRITNPDSKHSYPRSHPP